MTFRMDKQHEVLARHPGANNKDVSKIVGEMWRAAPEEVKDYYRKKAEQGRKEHMSRYPDYKYTPTKKRKDNVARRKGVVAGFESPGVSSSPGSSAATSGAATPERGVFDGGVDPDVLSSRLREVFGEGGDADTGAMETQRFDGTEPLQSLHVYKSTTSTPFATPPQELSPFSKLLMSDTMGGLDLPSLAGFTDPNGMQTFSDLLNTDSFDARVCASPAPAPLSYDFFTTDTHMPPASSTSTPPTINTTFTPRTTITPEDIDALADEFWQLPSPSVDALLLAPLPGGGSTGLTPRTPRAGMRGRFQLPLPSEMR
ncbi:hypothetical protein HK104_001306 [Borealophlyctis nickersoniae]|nr:hypothetical protein HK104_001306 [Borealophlyctis nickersoniae]